MTVNIVPPFEYDTSISAYESFHGVKNDFQRHPIAPVGCKVLTWDAPDHRGSWADHGVPGVYLGPALDHPRSFEVWNPNTSVPRITNTVWWFLADHPPDLTLTDPDPTLAYPPTKTRLHPLADGTDLIERTFFEPELGVCLIIGTGPVTQHRMASRAALARQRQSDTPSIQTGLHQTLTYKQLTSGDEHYSSLSEILHRIDSGPILLPPSDNGSRNIDA
jgi:hypothetical protein